MKIYKLATVLFLFFLVTGNILHSQGSFEVKISSNIESVAANNTFQVLLTGTSKIENVYKGFLEVENGVYISYRRNTDGNIVATIRSRDTGSVRVRVVPGKLISVDGLKNTGDNFRLEVKVGQALSAIQQELKNFGDQKKPEKKGFDFNKILEQLGGFGGMGGALSSLLGGAGFGGGKNATGNNPSNANFSPQPNFFPTPVQNTIPPGSETPVKNNPDGTKTVTVKTPEGNTVEKKVDEKGLVKSETVTLAPTKSEGSKLSGDVIIFVKSCNTSNDATVLNGGNVKVEADEPSLNQVSSPQYLNGKKIDVGNLNFASLNNNGKTIVILYSLVQGGVISQRYCTKIELSNFTKINSMMGYGCVDVPIFGKQCGSKDITDMVKNKFRGEVYSLKPHIKISVE